MTSDTPPSLEAAYEAFRGLHLSVLARLARQGFQVPIGDSMDVVHDFYVDAYPTLLKNFDAEQGNFTPYVYGAFYRFARRWIVKHKREDIALSALELDPGLEPEVERSRNWSQAELEAADRLLGHLTEVQQALLSAYLGADRPSLRELGRTFGISKRSARDHVVEAIAIVAARLERPVDVPPSDWVVIERTLRRGHSEKVVSEELGLTLQQVRNAKGRFLTMIRARLPSSKPRRTQRES